MKQQNFDIEISSTKSIATIGKELYAFRELFYILAWRDFKVRYKQTLIGMTWAVLRPLITMVVFTIIFSKIAGLPSLGDTPYSILVLTAMIPWYFFSSSFQEGSNSLIGNASMISKVYFPRIIIPISCLFVNFIDFCISLIILFLMMSIYRIIPSQNILFLPLFFLLLVLFTISLSIWMSAINVKYRDVKYVVPFLIQIGLYVSPVGFASSVVTNDWRALYSLNPMVGIIDGIRWCIIGGEAHIYWPGFFLSVFITIFLLVSGIMFFLKSENKFADII